MENFCRLCATKKASIQLISTISKEREKLIMYCRWKPSVRESDLPEHVCNWCSSMLDDCSKFIENVNSAEGKLIKMKMEIKTSDQQPKLPKTNVECADSDGRKNEQSEEALATLDFVMGKRNAKSKQSNVKNLSSTTTKTQSAVDPLNFDDFDTDANGAKKASQTINKFSKNERGEVKIDSIGLIEDDLDDGYKFIDEINTTGIKQPEKAPTDVTSDAEWNRVVKLFDDIPQKRRKKEISEITGESTSKPPQKISFNFEIDTYDVLTEEDCNADGSIKDESIIKLKQEYPFIETNLWMKYDFECSICQKICNDYCDFKSHTNLNHPNDLELMDFKCFYCKRSHKQYTQLFHHVTNVHMGHVKFW